MFDEIIGNFLQVFIFSYIGIGSLIVALHYLLCRKTQSQEELTDFLT